MTGYKNRVNHTDLISFPDLLDLHIARLYYRHLLKQIFNFKNEEIKLEESILTNMPKNLFYSLPEDEEKAIFVTVEGCCVTII